MSPHDLQDRYTPAQTGSLAKALRRLLDAEEKGRIQHTMAIVKSNGGRL